MDLELKECEVEMDQEETNTKSNAMNLKLKRFTMESIVLMSHRTNGITSIMFVDSGGHVWSVVDKFHRLVMFNATNEKRMQWLKSIEHRKTTIDLHERFRAVLQEGLDYAMCFDWLCDSCKPYMQEMVNGIMMPVQSDVNIVKLFNTNPNEPTRFERFFTSIDTPESIAIQYDLYAPTIGTGNG